MSSEQALLAGGYDHETYGAAKNAAPSETTTYRKELSFVARSSAPLVLSFFLQYFMSVISIYATGKLGPQELAAASLAICSFNITGLSVYQGMATSLDALCSQAYGAGKHTLVGVYFQRCSLIMLLLTAFPLAPMWWYSGTLLSYLVPDPELAQMSQTFLRNMILGAPGLLLFETGKRFLQAQHIFNAGTYILLVAVPISFVLNWLLVWHPTYGIGFVGASLATALSYWLISVLLFLYVVFIDGKKCWGGWDLRKASSNWPSMLSLAIPGVVMVEAEYLAFEVLTILAASFGTPALAAQSIASNIGSLVFQFPFAVSVAISTRMGHFVGRKDTASAQVLTRVSLLVSAAISLFDFSVVFFGRSFLTGIFTSDPEVMRIGKQVVTLVALNQLCDGTNVLEAGILRGQGRQRIGSLLSLCSYYAIALPVAALLAFVAKLGLPGLWGGLITGVAFLAASEFVCIYRSRWGRIIEEAAGRHDA